MEVKKILIDLQIHYLLSIKKDSYIHNIKCIEYKSLKKRQLPIFQGPMVRVSSAQLSFTSEFEMGSGGATAI
jgi:hypothetical protein